MKNITAYVKRTRLFLENLSIPKCQVKAQIKALFVKADFNYDSEEESKFEQHENEILSIKVKF